MAKSNQVFKFLFGLSLMLVFSFSGSLQAQKVTLKGRVMDKDADTPMPSATIVAINAGAGILSDDEGYYEFQCPKKDTIILRVTYIEYDTLIVNIVPGDRSVIETELYILPRIREDVVITAGRHEQKVSEVTNSMEVIKPKAIDVQATSNMEDVLQQAPGVDIIDGQPNIRGSSGFAYGVGSRVMVMLDGLPLLSADASLALFESMPTDNIAQVEIMKGASSVLYGSAALGGVINVITADAPSTPMTSIRLRQSVYDKPANELNDWDGNKSAFISSAHLFHTRKIGNHDLTALLDFTKDSGYRKGTDTEQYRGMIMTKFRPKSVPGLVFGANANYRRDSSGAFLYWDSYEPETVIDGSDTTQLGGALTGNGTLRKQLNTWVTFDPFLKYLTPRGNVHTYHGRVLRTKNTNDTQQANAGTLIYNDYQYLTTIFDGKISWINGVTSQFNFARGDSLYGGTHWAYNIAAYTQMDMEVSPRFHVSMGARYDRWVIDNEKIEASPIFRLGANYEVWPGGNARASFGQGFRSPSVAERFTSTVGGGLIIAPNPDILPEKGFSSEIGFRQGYRFGTDKKGVLGYIDIAFFNQDFENLTEFGVSGTTSSNPFDPNFGPIFSARNVTSARISGGEITLLVSGTHNKFRYDLSGGVTLLDPVNRNAVVDSLQVDFLKEDVTLDDLLGWLAPEGDPNKLYDSPPFLKYRSRWLSRFSGSLGYGRFNLTVNFQHKSAIKNIDQFLFVAIKGAADWQRANPGGYYLFNTIAAYDVLKNLKLSFHVNNLLNREYVILPGLMGEQRRFTGQVKYVF